MITTRGLVKRYEGPNARKTAVTGVDLHVPAGQLFTLLGPSGCGKTTTLRMIAGLERPSEGTITIGDQVVYDGARGIFVPPNRRPIGMVFQSYAIWPHMSVAENVMFPLTVGSEQLPKRAARERALTALDAVGLAAEADRPATSISGGQQQRVALARALVREPKVLLLDEPLSNLDAHLREKMRAEIRALQQRLGITAVYVTHDQAEALAISDLIMVMNAGEIVEVGTPQQIYRAPEAAFTASFIGVANAIDGRVLDSSPDGLVIETAAGLLRVSARDVAVGDDVRVYLRPESFDLSRKRHLPGDWIGEVRFAIYQGDAWDYTVGVAGVDLRVRVHKERVGLKHGDAVHLRPSGNEAVVMRLRDGRAHALPPRETTERAEPVGAGEGNR